MATENPTLVAGSGFVATGDAHLVGGYVAGRDMHVTVSPAAAPSDVFQLPSDIVDFTGREDSVADVQRLLRPPDGRLGTAAPVVLVTGQPGAGKTALAIHAAHQLRLNEEFPDGQLYVNLRGYEEQTLDPSRVLEGFLRTLGVEASAIPERLEDRAQRYRARLANRRVLVVLDNASAEAQVRPLRPGGQGGSALLITSRSRLSGLEAVQPVSIDVFSSEEALKFLARIVGQERIDAELPAARRIIRLCGYLPLAVRVAGARLAARPHWPVAKLAQRLGDERRRLSELKVGDLQVWTSLFSGYRGLHPRERKAFRLLGLPTGPDFAAWVAGALLDIDAADAEELVERLVDARMLEVAGVDPTGLLRYRFHDLLRDLARERLEKEESAKVRQEALERALSAYSVVAQKAAASVETTVPFLPGTGRSGAASKPWPSSEPGMVEVLLHDPLGWFAAERTSLVSAAEQAHDQGLWELTVNLVAPLASFFTLRSHWTDWEHSQELALSASQQAGDRRWEADALRGLARAYSEQHRWKEALLRLRESLMIVRETGDRTREAWTLLGMGDISTILQRFRSARRCLDACLSLFEQLDDGLGMAWTYWHLGIFYRFQGEYGEAQKNFQRALAAFRKLKRRRGEVMTLLNLGIIDRGQGRYSTALAAFKRCLPILAELGDARLQGYVWNNIGDLYREQGRLTGALEYLSRSLDVFVELRDSDGEAWNLLNIGMIYGSQGRFEDARRCLERSAALSRDLEDRQAEARALIALGETYRIQGRLDESLDWFEHGLRLLEPHDVGWHARVLRGRGLALAAQGDSEAAQSALREAMEVVRHLGSPMLAEIERQLQEVTARQTPGGKGAGS